MTKIYYLIILSVYISTTSIAQTKSIILGRPTDKSITVSVYFDQNVEFYVEYGTKSGEYVAKTANTTFKFVVEGDEHLHDKKGVPNLFKITLQNMLKAEPDFMVSMGDMFGDDHTPNTTTSADMDFYHRDLLQYLTEACHSMPFFFCLGNHEGESGYYLRQNPPNNIAVYATNWRKFYFANPFPNGFYTGNSVKEAHGMDLPENYYAFTWGDALFVVLDVYRHCDINEKPQNWDWTLGKTQYDWLKQTLETSKAKYKFVFGHHTRGQGRGAIVTAKDYEWGGNNGKNTYEFDTKRAGWGLPIHQLMVNNGVNIFFQGHDHLYAKESLDGLIYQETPMACDSTYTIGMLANADAYTDVKLDGSGHLVVTVSPENVKVEYVRAYLPTDTKDGKRKNGEVAHSYTVVAGNTNPNPNPNPVILGTNTMSYSTNEMKVYPNPTFDKLKVELPEKTETFEIKVFDSFGKMVLQPTSPEIDMSSFASGTYLLYVETKNQKFTKKVIITH